MKMVRENNTPNLESTHTESYPTEGTVVDQYHRTILSGKSVKEKQLAVQKPIFEKSSNTQRKAPSYSQEDNLTKDQDELKYLHSNNLKVFSKLDYEHEPNNLMCRAAAIKPGNPRRQNMK
ncbi:hypothetical protein FQR65_LT10409 [Abscondita terminalis]|nr:hypothetical protein FQR65_LT10409 [Abscondita terminalis]